MEIHKIPSEKEKDTLLNGRNLPSIKYFQTNYVVSTIFLINVMNRIRDGTYKFHRRIGRIITVIQSLPSHII